MRCSICKKKITEDDAVRCTERKTDESKIVCVRCFPWYE